MIIIIYLNFYIPGGSVKDIMTNHMHKGEPRDMLREDDFLEEVNQERANKSYYPTYEDIIDICTIGKVDDSSAASAFGGGL
jgi:hypothetical protein